MTASSPNPSLADTVVFARTTSALTERTALMGVIPVQGMQPAAVPELLEDELLTDDNSSGIDWSRHFKVAAGFALGAGLLGLVYVVATTSAAGQFAGKLFSMFL